jgi:S-adenosylmethionine synthetase
LRPDGKTQVSVEYDGYTPVRVTKIVVATQHMDMLEKFNNSEDAELSYIRKNLIKHVIQPVLKSYDIECDENFIINGTGRFVEGGPKADTGLTGRKIIVDTYGGYARHGGGAFSGKDPSKVDRSAAYMTRYIAKNIVAADLAERCEVQLAYSIGVAEPVSVLVETFGTGKLTDEALTSIVKRTFDLKPAGIIHTLNLKRPIYQPLAAYGHLGRKGFSWENTDKIDQLKILASEESVNG